MINGMILNQSIYNESYNNNEDLTLKLLIENVQLESQLCILEGGSIKDRFDSFIASMKKLKDRFIAFINKQIDKIMSILKKKSTKQEKKIVDIEIKSFIYDISELKDLMLKSSKPIDYNKSTAENIINSDISEDDYTKEILEIIKVKSIDDISSINMIKMETITSDKINKIIVDLEKMKKDFESLKNHFDSYTNGIIEESKEILKLLEKKTDFIGKYTSSTTLFNHEDTAPKIDKACNIVMKRLTISRNIILKLASKVLSSMGECISFNSKYLNK